MLTQVEVHPHPSHNDDVSSYILSASSALFKDLDYRKFGRSMIPMYNFFVGKW
jgi:hypothetical protein